MSHISVALMTQYLNVRRRKLGTIIIQTVYFLQHDSADTGSLPLEDFEKHHPSYFYIIQPGRSTVTPPFQWRRLLQEKLARGTFFAVVVKTACSLLNQAATTTTIERLRAREKVRRAVCATFMRKEKKNKLDNKHLPRKAVS
jgi:hypothetical protein